MSAMRSRLLASTAAPTRISNCLSPLDWHRFIPRPRNSTEMRPSMPAAKSLAFLERRAALESVLLSRLVSSALRDGDLSDSVFFAGLHIVRAEEAPIGGVEFGRAVKGLLVTIQRGLDVDGVGGIAVQHLIVG